MHCEGRRDFRIDLKEWSLDMQKLLREELPDMAISEPGPRSFQGSCYSIF